MTNNNWNALAIVLSMPYNNLLMHNLKMEAAKGKEFVTITFGPYLEDQHLNVSEVYSSHQSDSHYFGHLSFETKGLLTFIEQMKGEMSQRLCLALVADPIAMGASTKLSHDSKSKQFLNFSFTKTGISTTSWLTNIPKTFDDPSGRNASCSVTEFRAWRKHLFKIKNKIKISKDQNTITLDDGRVFEAKKQKPDKFCSFCGFLAEPEELCYQIKCKSTERNDGQKVFFVEVKNEN